MRDLWEGIGIALVIIALAIGLKGCAEHDKPFVGKNGSIWATGGVN